MTMHKALHPRDDVERLYVSRKEGGRELASIEDSFDASIQRLEYYIGKHERGLTTSIRNNTDNIIIIIIVNNHNNNNLTARRKKLQVLGNIGSGHHQENGVSQGKLLKTNLYHKNLI